MIFPRLLLLEKLFSLLFLVLFLSSISFAIEIGDGDIYQQSSTSSWVSDDLILWPGGTIIDRDDGNFTYFLGDHIYQISGGVVDTRLNLDNGSQVSISGGGVFNNYLYIDRMYGSIDISGGLFQSIVDISRYTGDVVISGGVFNDYFRISYSTTGAATPTFTLNGYNWKVDGVPIDFPTDAVEISGYSGGVLTGNLSDGNEFSRFIDTRMAPVGGYFWSMLQVHQI